MQALLRRNAPREIEFDWKSRNDSGRGAFNRAVSQIVQSHSVTLKCNIGSDAYWAAILKDATEVRPTGNYPISDVVLMYANAAVVGFAIIRFGKLCVEPGADSDDRTPAVCKFNQPSWYIEFICTAQGQGYGKLLIENITEKATERRLRYICLSALPSVIMFYHNLGFKLTLNLECVEKPEISALTTRIRDDIARRKATGSPPLADIDELLADTAFNELLIRAMGEKLSAVRNRGESCTDLKSCVEDGVYMMMCLPQKEMRLTGFEPLFRQLMSASSESIALDDDPVYQQKMQEFQKTA